MDAYGLAGYGTYACHGFVKTLVGQAEDNEPRLQRSHFLQRDSLGDGALASQGLGVFASAACNGGKSVTESVSQMPCYVAGTDENNVAHDYS